MRTKNPQLQQRILQAAQHLLTAGGPAAISMRAIAAEVGVATGTVYNYYADKDTILRALAMGFWGQALETLPDKTKPFEAWLAGAYTQLRGHVAGFRALLLPGLRGGSRAAMQGHMGTEAALHARLGQIVADQLAADSSIRVFDNSFTAGDFARFVTQQLLLLLQLDEDIAYFMEIVGRLLRAPTHTKE